MDLSINRAGGFRLANNKSDFQMVSDEEFAAQYVWAVATTPPDNRIIDGAGIPEFVGQINNEANGRKMQRQLESALNRGLTGMSTITFNVDVYPTSPRSVRIPVFATVLGVQYPASIIEFSYTDGVSRNIQPVISNAPKQHSVSSNPILRRNMGNI